MLRPIVLLVAAAACLEAGAQPMSVTTIGGSALVWQGECVRTLVPRNQRTDPCPNIEDYAGPGPGRPRTRKEVKEQIKRGDNRHNLAIWNLVEPEAETDVVRMQWPTPEDFKESGWPRHYKVVLLFGPPLSQKKPLPPVVECLEPPGTPTEKCEPLPVVPVRTATVPDIVGRTVRQAESRATDAELKIQKGTRVPQERENRIEHQWPAAGDEVAVGSAIEYLLAQPQSANPCPQGERCQIAGENGANRCPIGQSCREPPPAPCGPDAEPCPESTAFVPVPVKGEAARTTVLLGGAAGGAGVAGGYLLSRLLRRRQDDEEDEASADAAGRVLLNARVHPDRKGVQQVEPL